MVVVDYECWFELDFQIILGEHLFLGEFVQAYMDIHGKYLR